MWVKISNLRLKEIIYLIDALIIVFGEIEGIVGLIVIKLLLRNILLQATSLSTEWLETGLIVLLMKGFIGLTDI